MNTCSKTISRASNYFAPLRILCHVREDNNCKSNDRSNNTLRQSRRVPEAIYRDEAARQPADEHTERLPGAPHRELLEVTLEGTNRRHALVHLRSDAQISRRRQLPCPVACAISTLGPVLPGRGLCKAVARTHSAIIV